MRMGKNLAPLIAPMEQLSHESTASTIFVLYRRNIWGLTIACT